MFQVPMTDVGLEDGWQREDPRKYFDRVRLPPLGAVFSLTAHIGASQANAAAHSTDHRRVLSTAVIPLPWGHRYNIPAYYICCPIQAREFCRPGARSPGGACSAPAPHTIVLLRSARRRCCCSRVEAGKLRLELGNTYGLHRSVASRPAAVLALGAAVVYPGTAPAAGLWPQ